MTHRLRSVARHPRRLARREPEPARIRAGRTWAAPEARRPPTEAGRSDSCSFRDEQQLNLTPVYGDDTADDSPQAVRVAGIFGANASGKSNCLDALTFMRKLAVESDRLVEPGMGLTRSPFRLDPEVAAEPSRYVVDLLLDGVRHTYGFSIDDDRVLEEWLYRLQLLLLSHPEPEETLRSIVDLVQAADVGIDDAGFTYDASERVRNLTSHLARSGEMSERIRRAVEQMGPRLELAHRGSSGPVYFDLEDESTGTGQLLTLGLQAATVLLTGGTMLVDEIDASLHPLLTAKLVGMFRSRSANPKGSQLIFTSHDASLLGTLDAEEARQPAWCPGCPGCPRA